MCRTLPGLLGNRFLTGFAIFAISLVKNVAGFTILPVYNVEFNGMICWERVGKHGFIASRQCHSHPAR